MVRSGTLLVHFTSGTCRRKWRQVTTQNGEAGVKVMAENETGSEGCGSEAEAGSEVSTNAGSTKKPAGR